MEFDLNTKEGKNKALWQMIFEYETMDLDSLDDYNEFCQFILDNINDFAEFVYDTDIDMSLIPDNIREVTSQYFQNNLYKFCEGGNDTLAEKLEELGYCSERDIQLIAEYGLTYDMLSDGAQALICNPAPLDGPSIYDLDTEDLADWLIWMLSNNEEKDIEAARRCLEDHMGLSEILEDDFDIDCEGGALGAVLEECAEILCKVVKDKEVADYIRETYLDDYGEAEEEIEYVSEVAHYAELLAKSKNSIEGTCNIVRGMYLETILNNWGKLGKYFESPQVQQIIYKRVIDSLDYSVEYNAKAVASIFNTTGVLEWFSCSKETKTELYNNGLSLEIINELS